MMTIYFTQAKKIEVKDRLLTIMANTVSENFKNQRPNYLEATTQQVDKNQEVRAIIAEQLNQGKIVINDFSYKSNIQQAKNEWYADMPKHTYDLLVAATSVEYTCVHIMDEKNYLCYHNDDKQLRKINVLDNMKVFIK